MADLQALLEKLSGSKAGQTAGALLQGGSVDHLDWPDYAKTTIANTRQMLPPPANPATPSPGWNQGVRDVAHGMFVQPVEDAAKALRGQMTANEAQDFAFGAAAGLIPMGRGLRPNIIKRGAGQYDVRVGDTFAGTASVAADGNKPFMSAVALEPGFQRQGIGTEIYNTVEQDIGRKLVPSPLGLTPEATAFWKKRLASASPQERAALLDEAASLGRGYGIKDADIESRLAALRQQGIRAYHGSPHDFDRFDMSKIGTGEGAQSYGHGLYFAENEKVARQYRDNLAVSSKANSFNWNPDGTPRRPGQIASQLDAQISEDEIIGGLRVLEPKATDAQIAKWMDEGRGLYAEAQKAGRMYEVNINAHPDQFLDWDKPLSKQGEQIQDALRGITPPHQRGQNAVAAAGVIGPEFGKAAASKNLLDRGIPGIKYLDQGSRTAGEGSRNYVVFDDKLIDILRKYGIAGIGVGGVLGSGFVPKEAKASE